MAALKTAKRLLLGILGVWVLLYASFSLFVPPLLDDADSVHAEVAREMVVSHDWTTLHANGIRYLEKAPLMYWSMAASFRLFGVSDWSARLPLALYSLALFFVIFLLGERMFANTAAGFYAALLLMTSVGIFIFGHLILPDVMLCLWMTLAMFFFWRSLYEERPSLWTAVGFGVACALNVLTKGIIGILFPLAVVFLFLLITRNLKHLFRWHVAVGVVVFLLIAVPWHILAGLANPTQGHPVGLLPTQGNVRGFFWFYFVNEHVLRFLNLRIPRDYDTVPLLLFWGLLLIWMVPWFAFAIRPLLRVPFRKALARQPLDRADQRRVFLTLWFLVIMLFFSFSTRQEYYVLPALPAVALLAAGWLAADEKEVQGETGLRIARWLFAFGMVGAGMAIYLALRGHTPAPGTDLSTLLNQHPEDYALSFGHFLDLNLDAMGAFRLPLVLVALSLVVGTMTNLWLRFKDKRRLANCFLVGMMCGILIAAHIALAIFSPVLSSQVLALAIRAELAPEDLVVLNSEYEAGSSVAFYLDRQVYILNGRSSNLWYGSFFSDAPDIFKHEDWLAERWNGPERVFVFTEAGKMPPVPGPSYVVAKSGGKEIVSNEPNSGGAEF
ncbi:MAG TPA: glycosyltransferase family 39 protein [Acidisarcina sp.]|nr:glycosyltransferase family 39 protein [Acidisarcina sp.]